MPKGFYTAIDVGESLTKLVKVSIVNERMHICSTYTAQTKGIKRGEIYSKSEVQSTIATLIERAKVDQGYPINEVILILPSNKINIYCKKLECRINDTHASMKDIEFLHKNIATKLDNKNEIVVQTIPVNYTKDGENLGRRNPDGLKCSKIGLEAILVAMPYGVARGLVNILEDMNITVLDAIPSPIAHGSLLLKPEEYQTGALIADLGGEGSSLSFYKNGLLKQHIRVDKGINLIIDDLMKTYNIDYKEATGIIENFGCASIDAVTGFNIFQTKYDGTKVKESDIATILDVNLRSIIQAIQKAIDILIEQNKDIPLIITGYGAHIRNIEQMFSNILNIPCDCRMYQRIGGRDHQYTTCIGGLVSYLTKNGIINPDNV